MRIVLVAVLLGGLSLPAYAGQKGQGRGWRFWKRGAASATKDTTRREAKPRRSLARAVATRTALPHVRPRITAIGAELDARLARMAKDPSLEFDLLHGLSPLVGEVRALADASEGDREATAELRAYAVKLANALAPVIGTTTVRIRESDPTTATGNLRWIRQISQSPYSDWGIGGLESVNRELRVGLGNLATARQQVALLDQEFTRHAVDIGWLADKSGVELKIPTVAQMNERIDQAEQALRRVHGRVKSAIIASL